MKSKLFAIILVLLFSSVAFAQMNMAEVAAYIQNHQTLITTNTTNIAKISAGTTAFTKVLIDSGVVAGQDVFTTTAETDTVTCTGMTADDLVMVTGVFTSAVDQQDVLQTEALTDKFVVHRLASGESALKYNWFWIKTEN